MSATASGPTPSTGGDTASLAAVARLFGELLLNELDGPHLARLQDGETRTALASVGLEVPGVDPEDRDALDDLAAGYHAAFLKPEGAGAPPIGSLWTEGRYEGALAARIRELARSSAMDFDGAAARDAPVDHLGCVLQLWAAASARAPWVSDEIAADHLAWAEAPLARVANECEGFYADVAGAAGSFVAVLRETRLTPPVES